MTEFVGRSGALFLFTDGDRGVVVDSGVNLIVASGQSDMLAASRTWESDTEFTIEAEATAISGLVAMDSSITASAGRMYTIPKGVQAEAKKALKWHAEFHRGGTSVGLNTARTLARGGQIGIEKLRHVSKYFPRHEVDKKGKGWAPSEDGFPSNGRIAWALWGGDAAWRWASAIVEREDKKPVTAGSGLPDTSAFEAAYSLEEEMAPEFIARVWLDGTGMDRLYKIDLDGQVYVWDDAQWDNLGHDHQDIWNYDNIIDDGEDLENEVTHLAIDPESAIFIAARFAEDPYTKVTIEDIDTNEAELVQSALSEIDWAFIDETLIAATPVPAPAAPADGVYTPEERAKNASSQVRDKTGRFSSTGQKVMIGGNANLNGTITRVNPKDSTVNVKLSNGKQITISAKQVEALNPNNQTVAIPGRATQLPHVDTSGILGEPRQPINSTHARIPGTLPAMTAKDLQTVISDWPAYVKSQRDAFVPGRSISKVGVQARNSMDVGKRGAETIAKSGKSLILDAHDHPLLKNWFGGKNKQGYNNSMWYNPITAAVGDAPKQLTPDTTDVQPIYMAVVDQDDPQAVLNLVCLVPESDQSTAPMIYSRHEGKWVRDEKTLQDLNSPTPPPVVPLDADTLDNVLSQVDQTQSVTASIALTVLFGNEPIVAAGGLDKNRGNAEDLRRYWTRGAGAAKIRWGTGGDWKRCVRYLSKYLGERAKGYCQLRHKDALGYYTSTHAKMDRAKHNSTDEFAKKMTTEEQDKEVEENDDMDLSVAPEEVMYSFPGDVIGHEIPLGDLKTPLDEILAEYDDMYDEEWEPDSQVIGKMNDLAKCSDDEFALIAAGGADRNRGGAEKLRKYWTVGKGGAKIRWGTPGDWTRCVRNLSKYLGPRAKGYCALRHKEMDGFWPGDKKNFSGREYGLELFSTDYLRTEDEIITAAALRARKAEASNRMALIAGVYEVNENTYGDDGSAFKIPLVIPEDVESGDGRMFKKDAIEIRDLPLPLLWQIKTGSGHDGSVVVGRIDHMEHTDQGIGNAYGVFDKGEYGQEAERLVRGGFLRGVSADMDRFEAEEVAADDTDADAEKNNQIKKDKIVINKARVMAVTIVPKPAFQECSIQLVEEEEPKDSQEETVDIPDGIYVEDVDPQDAEAIVASGMIAGAIPVTPPIEWFDNPKLAMATPLSIDDDGRVFGHIAAWDTDHIGLPFGTRPPRSRSKYGYFHTGVCRTDGGKDVPVGQLTLAGGHADITASAAEAVKHYDDTASAVADVHAGEDAYGIWVAGALRPGTTPEQIRALRASAPSGDWRPVRGSLELVAVCQVNVPGFPIARARVASGQVMALVAAGASTLAKMRHNPLEELSTRLERLEMNEKQALVAAAEEAKAKFAALRPEKEEAIIADGFYDEVEPQLVSSLEQLLADTVAFTYRSKGYHWNVKGQDFAQYHELFDDVYSDADGAIDPIAENIRKLGFDTPFDIVTFAQMSPLSASHVESAQAEVMAYDLYEATQYMIAQCKNVFSVANAANEQGIANFLAERIDSHQKWAWQLKASCTPAGAETLVDESGEESYEEFFSTEAVVASAEERVSRVAAFAALTEFAKFTEEERKALAKKGEALPDGSFPIRNVADLKNAVHAYGRANLADQPKVRKHIIKRATDLGHTELVPAVWAEAKHLPKPKSYTFSADELRDRIAEFSARQEDSKKA